MITNMIKRFLKSIDMYGTKVEFNFQKQNVHKTLIGGITSLIICACFGFGCYYYGLELVQKKQPIVITNDRFVRTPQKMVFDKVQSTMMIGLRDKNTKAFKDPTLVTVHAQLMTMMKEKKGEVEQFKAYEKKEIKLKSCSIDDMKVEELTSYFSKLELEFFYCFDDSEEIYIEGDFDGDNYVRIEVFFEQCRNSTLPNSVVCASQEVIDDRLKLGYFEAYFIDKTVDPTIIDQPFQKQGRNIYSLASSKMGKEVHAQFANYYIKTDVGVIQEQIEEMRDFVFAQQVETFSFENPAVIIKFVMRTLKHKEFVMQRRYLKITDLIAQIGGTLKVIVVLGYFITLPFIQLHFNKQIVNDIFNFDVNQNFLKNKKDKKNINNKSHNSEIQKSKSFPVNVQQILTENGNICFQKNAENACFELNIDESQKINLCIQNQTPITNDNLSKHSEYLQHQSPELQSQKLQTQINQEYSILSPLFNQNSAKLRTEFNERKKRRCATRTLSFQKSEFRQTSDIPAMLISQYNERDNNNTTQNLDSINEKTEQNEVFQQSFLNKLDIIKLFKDVKDFFKPVTNTIYYSTCDYFKHICFPFLKELKTKKLYLDHSIEIIKQHLDILYILNKFLEIDKLKSILLTEDQMKLFEYLPKPNVSFDSESKKLVMNNNYYNKSKTNEQKAIDAYQSFKNILLKEKKSYRDIKLLELLDYNIPEFQIAKQNNSQDVDKQLQTTQKQNNQEHKKQNVQFADQSKAIQQNEQKQKNTIIQLNSFNNSHRNYSQNNNNIEVNNDILELSDMVSEKSEEEKVQQFYLKYKQNSKNI